MCNCSSPVHGHRLSGRATKCALMFIVLTVAAFFFLLLLLGVLAVIMAVTRKVGWFSVMGAPAQRAQ